MNQEKIGRFIQQKRKEKDLTQEELAQKLGVSNRTISKWENGRGMPDYSVILDLCKVLDMSINEMLSGEEIKNEDYQTMLEENILKTIEFNNKKRNKKNLKIAAIIILVLGVILYSGYKFLLLHQYNLNDFEYPEIIKKDMELNDKANTVVLSELSMYIPEGFELKTDTSNLLVEAGCELYASENSRLGTDDNYGTFIKVCPIKNSIFDTEDIMDSDDGIYFDKFSTYKVLEHFNVSSYYDLYEYLLNNKNKKYNIFTNRDALRMNAIITNQLVAPSKVYIYKGNIEGATDIITYENNELVAATSEFKVKDGRYDYMLNIFNIKNPSFNEDDVFEILSSIKQNS